MRSLLLLAAAIIAVVAGLAALQWSSKNNADVPAPAPVSTTHDVNASNVLVARQDIPVGTVITEEMLDKQPWPSHLVLEGFITGEPKDSGIIGKIARAPIQAREPIVLNRLASADQPGFLASVLTAGMRAITVATDPVTGVAGYVFPGDRVDIMFVHNPGGQAGNSPVSEVLVSNVRVLAVNVRDQSAGLASVVTGAAGAPSTVTMEVSEEMAQKIRLAEKVGGLSLSLRSMHDKDKKETFKVSYVNELSSVGAKGGEVLVIRGTADAPAPAAAVAPAAGGSLPGLLGGLLR